MVAVADAIETTSPESSQRGTQTDASSGQPESANACVVPIDQLHAVAEEVAVADEIEGQLTGDTRQLFADAAPCSAQSSVCSLSWNVVAFEE